MTMYKYELDRKRLCQSHPRLPYKCLRKLEDHAVAKYKKKGKFGTVPDDWNNIKNRKSKFIREEPPSMATEIRRLIFSHSETTTAIRNAGAAHGMKFPEGRIIRARYAGNAEYEFHSMKSFKAPIQGDYNVKETPKAITLTFFDEKTFEQKFINLTADFISAALIEYCINNKIMMPKNAEKILDLTEFNVCMDINLESMTESGGSPLKLDE